MGQEVRLVVVEMAGEMGLVAQAKEEGMAVAGVGMVVAVAVALVGAVKAGPAGFEDPVLQ
jgi:hypothetical protein